MSTVSRPPLHRNVVILFDAGRLRDNPDARTCRSNFGRGILRSVPHTRCPFTQADLDEIHGLFDDSTHTTPCPDRLTVDGFQRFAALSTRYDVERYYR
jgi:hypothetical protein